MMSQAILVEPETRVKVLRYIREKIAGSVITNIYAPKSRWKTEIHLLAASASEVGFLHYQSTLLMQNPSDLPQLELEIVDAGSPKIMDWFEQLATKYPSLSGGIQPRISLFRQHGGGYTAGPYEDLAATNFQFLLDAVQLPATLIPQAYGTTPTARMAHIFLKRWNTFVHQQISLLRRTCSIS